MPHIDLTFQQTIHEVKLAVLFHCPVCERPITQRNRVAYPAIVAQLFGPVYHCRCGRHWGALVSPPQDQVESAQPAPDT